MSQAKRTSKRLSKAIPMTGIAGVSLALAGGASAATAPAINTPSQGLAPLHVFTLGEEELSDVSLSTFYVFDKENAAASGQQFAGRGCRGCAGCRGCRGCRGCGRGCGGGGCGGCLGGCGGCSCGCCLSWGACRLC
jgi:hypothetical protein